MEEKGKNEMYKCASGVMADVDKGALHRGKIPKEGRQKVPETLQGEKKPHIGQKMAQERIPRP